MSRETTVELFVGAISDQSRNFASGITTETLVDREINVSPATGLAVVSSSVSGTSVNFRIAATVVGTYKVTVLAILSDGERLDHRVTVIVT